MFSANFTHGVKYSQKGMYVSKAGVFVQWLEVQTTLIYTVAIGMASDSSCQQLPDHKID